MTVLDFRMHTNVVDRAIRHFQDGRWDEVRTLEALESLLFRFPDEREGNTAVALYLWGYRYWTRVALLRRLVDYFRARGVTSQRALSQWARNSNYERDMKGQILGIGLAVYNWLVMRQGVDTIKPDVHLKRFVRSAIGRELADSQVVDALIRTAKELNMKAYQLDWNIWEHQRVAVRSI